MKTAILQVADTGPLESLVWMLESAGYQCYTLSDKLINVLKGLGCDTVFKIEDLVNSGSYDKPFDLPIASVEMMKTVDLYVDVKAQRNAERVWSKWPRLKDKTMWYRINGGEPSSSPKYGDEINIPCPILTPNLWYATEGPWSNKAYACWPPFYRFEHYLDCNSRSEDYEDPLCLVHNFRGWGYHVMQEGMQHLGVKIYGDGSPDRAIPHNTLPNRLSKALAMVHLKSNDAPGYALYEALAAGCPVIVSERLLIKHLMRDLFIDGETCLVFDRVADESRVHHTHTEEEVTASVLEVKKHLEFLRTPENNKKIGEAGHQRLKEVMWNRERDSASLFRFMKRCFV
jgi:hypothetical protein